MKPFLIIGGIALAGFVLVLSILIIWILGMYNTQSGLKNQYESKIAANRAIFDNTYKKIDQSAQVTQAQKNALKEIFTSYAEGRSGNGGGSLATSVKEAIPTVDVSIYRELMNVITGARDEFTANQIHLVSISEQYNLNLSRQPSGFILKFFGFDKIDPKIITSTRTENVFFSGKDDDMTLPIK